MGTMSTRGTKLQRAFRAVRKDFFPRWDRERRWRARASGLAAGLFSTTAGTCDRRTQLIRVAKEAADKGDDELNAILIHEICHAIIPGGHGRRFLDRMLKAAAKADALGKHRLAELLRDDVAIHQGHADAFTNLAEEMFRYLVANPRASGADLLSHLFQNRGFRGFVGHDDSLRRQEPGSGIAVSKKIMEEVVSLTIGDVNDQ